MNEELLQQAVGQRGEKVRPHPRAHSYLAALAAGGVLSVALFYGALAALLALDRLTPPPVSGTWCIDNRFAWLRERPDWKNASLIAVGSSATLRNLNFRVVSSTVQQWGAVNAAPCFLTVNQNSLSNGIPHPACVEAIDGNNGPRTTRFPRLLEEPDSIFRSGSSRSIYRRKENRMVALLQKLPFQRRSNPCHLRRRPPTRNEI